MNEVEGKAKKDELFPPKIEIKSFIHRKKEKKRSHVKLMQKLGKKSCFDRRGWDPCLPVMVVGKTGKD